MPRPLRDWAFRTFAGHRPPLAWLGVAELDAESRNRMISDLEPWEHSHAAG